MGPSMRSLLAWLLLLPTSLAAADQCQVISPEVARWAQKIVVQGASFVMRCEPCDDSAPTPPMQVRRVVAKPWSGDKTQMTLSINGKEVDLAYTYVQTGAGTYTNVALLTGCPATGVSPFWSPDAAIATTAPEPPQPPPPPPPVKHDRSPIGIVSCDTFMRRYEVCVKQKFPAESRQAAMDAIDQMRDAWRQAATTPEGRSAMDTACKQAMDAVKESLSSMGCTF
jgi:hypothetical protein